MEMIRPVTVDDTVLISSTAAEDDYAAWNAATNYAVGNRVIRTTTHAVYENLIAGVDATAPENAPTRWVYVRPTNKYAMFDSVIGTSTSLASPLTVVLEPGRIGGLSMFELVGESLQIDMLSSSGGSSVYSITVDLDQTEIFSFYDYFFAEYVQRESVALTNLPTEYTDPELTVTLTGTGTVSAGVLAVGRVFDLGRTLYGATLRRQDFSKKTTDDFGYISVVQRTTRKLMSSDLIIEYEYFAMLDRLMREMQSIPAVYVATTEDEFYDPLNVYGFVTDFRIVVQFPKYLSCNIEIEGLV